jgi:hypothetical protein
MKLSVYQVPSLSAESLPILNNILTRLTHALNSIEFGTLANNENIWCDFIVVDGGTANEACSSAHTLNRTPLGTIVIWQNKAATLYKPTETISADTSTEVFYKFDTAATSAVLLLI